MTMPSKKHIGISLVSLLLAVSFCYGLQVLYAGKRKTFVTCQIGEISNFRECSHDILQIVARKMGVELNENIPKPLILTDTQISPKEFSLYLGCEVEVVCPYYFHKRNTIVIPLDCRLDSLAHELVHYFQVMYQNENLGFDCGPDIENLEMEAVAIQRWFKSKYLEPQKPKHGIAG